jgi:pimeloyl-ACP methyl ester carboxylesterase
MAHEITGHYTTVDNARVFYDECGDGIPLVCIHMGGACSLQWQYFLPLMAAHGIRAIAPDLPGHSRSYPVNWQPFNTMSDYAEWVWRFMQTVCPGEKPLVCGSGIGGDMTLTLACEHPQGIRAGMAFECAASTGTLSFLSQYSEPHTFPGFQSLVDLVSTSAMYYPCDEEKVIESKWQHRCTYQATMVGDMEAWNDHDVSDRLKNIECPIFMFKGEADYHIPDQDVVDTLAAIPKGLGEGGIAKGMGHLIMMEQPEKLAEACIGFLQRRAII